MKCPICVDSDLHIAERHGIEVDWCVRCRGVWLDRGELDKLISRAGHGFAEVMPDATARRGNAWSREDTFFDDDYRRPPRRKSLLREILDFD